MAAITISPFPAGVAAQSGGLIMSDSGSGNTGGAWRSCGAANFQPHPFDPLLQPELFRGVLTPRRFSFPIYLLLVAISVPLCSIFISAFRPLTLSPGWL